MVIATQGAESLVNTTTLGSQSGSQAALLSDGRYVVVWEDPGSPSDLRFQIFNTDGSKSGSEHVIASSSTMNGLPTVAGLADGGFVVAFDRFTSESRSSYTVAAARFDAGGVQIATDVIVESTQTRGAYSPQVTAVSSGYAIAYSAFANVYDAVTVKVYDSSNTLKASANSLEMTGLGDQIIQGMATLADGNIAVLWQNLRQPQLKVAIFSPTGAVVTSAVDVLTVAGSGEHTIEALDTGGFVVGWSYTGIVTGIVNVNPPAIPDNQGYSIQARIYDAHAVPLTDGFTVNATIAGNQTSPAITAVAGGQFVVSWVSDTQPGQIFTQLLGYSGHGGPDFLTAETTINPLAAAGAAVTMPELITLANGKIVATWTDSSGTLGDPSGTAIHQQQINAQADTGVRGTAGGDTLAGSPTLANEIHGLAGDDTIIGGRGPDRLYGDSGNDIIDDGGAGGVDRLYGGAGNDAYVVHSQSAFVYEAADEGADIIFADGTDYSLVSGAGGANIEGLVIRSAGKIGTGSDNADLLMAYADNVQLNGGKGNDTLVAYGSGDLLVGGQGNDIYVVNTKSVTIRESAGEGTDDLYADGIDFSLLDSSNVENLILRGTGHTGTGSNRGDLLISGGMSNSLIGGGGNDIFSFTPAHGASHVLDFNSRAGEHDIVAFTTTQFADFATMQAHLTQVGANAVITAVDGSGDTFTLDNFMAANLSAADFIFGP
jgi:hypothetical protein